MRQKPAFSLLLVIFSLVFFRGGEIQSTDLALGQTEGGSGGWMISEIDDRYIGAFPAINTDSKGGIHVTYYNVDDWQSKERTGILKYARWTGDGWEKTTVDRKKRLDLGRYSDLVIDSMDGLHVGYWDATTEALRYAVKIGKKSWKVKVIEKGDSQSRGLSLALDSKDHPHFAYHSRGFLKYASKVGRDWEIEQIGKVGKVLESPGIAIDDQDKVHMVFYDRLNGEVRYVTKVSGEWSHSLIDKIGDGIPAPLIAIGQTGIVHVVYYDTKKGLLKYSSLLKDRWENQTIGQVGDIKFNSELLDYTPLEGSPVKPAITVDDGGRVHLSFFQGENHTLAYGVLVAGSWKTQLVEFSPDQDVGRYSSIVVDDDKIRIVYRDSTSNILKYAVRPILNH